MVRAFTVHSYADFDFAQKAVDQLLGKRRGRRYLEHADKGTVGGSELMWQGYYFTLFVEDSTPLLMRVRTGKTDDHYIDVFDWIDMQRMKEHFRVTFPRSLRWIDFDEIVAAIKAKTNWFRWRFTTPPTLQDTDVIWRHHRWAIVFGEISYMSLTEKNHWTAYNGGKLI